VKLPIVHHLSPEEVRDAFADWMSKHKIPPDEPRRTVAITVAWFPDGSVTCAVSEPVSTTPPDEPLQ
jgi:hypothetical protein